MVRLGDSLKDGGKPDEAEAWYERALAVDERLAREFPDEPRALTTLVWSMDRLAAAAGADGQTGLQRARHARQLALAERLNALADGVDERRAVSAAHAHAADWALRDRRLADALDHAEHAVDAARAAASLDPENRYAEHTLIAAVLKRASVYAAAGRRDTALADAESAARHAQRVADSDPREVCAAWQLLCALADAAAKAESAGDLSLAVEYARRRVDQAGHVARLQPTNPAAREAAAGAAAPLARLEELLARRE